jgi:hypothetical protein
MFLVLSSKTYYTTEGTGIAEHVGCRTLFGAQKNDLDKISIF